jgi:hypothetical protein
LGTTFIQLDALGNPLSQTSESGQVTTYTYDAQYAEQGLPATTTQVIGLPDTQVEIDAGTGDDLTVTHSYNQYGQPTSEIDSRGNATTTIYDYGRAVWQTERFAMPYSTVQGEGTSPAVRATHTLYDSRGRVVATETYEVIRCSTRAVANTPRLPIRCPPRMRAWGPNTRASWSACAAKRFTIRSASRIYPAPAWCKSRRLTDRWSASTMPIRSTRARKAMRLAT